MKNKGKSNIYVYAQSVSDPNILDSQRVFLINPNPGVLAPGDQFDLKMNSIISSSTDFMQTIADLMYAGKGSDFLIRVAFMTPDKQKYLLDTKVTIKTKNEVATVLFEGSQIRKFNWGEED